MPDQQADRVLRSIEQNNGELSNALAKQMPILSKPGVWADLIEVVSEAFQEELPADSHILNRYHPSRPAGRES